MDIIISNSSGEPIYRQISKQIKTQILSGVIEPGIMLPSIRCLAKQLNISVITTQKAYEELECGGFVRGMPGKGFFVEKQNSELLSEMRLKRVEEILAKAVNEGRRMGISNEQINNILNLLLED